MDEARRAVCVDEEQSGGEGDEARRLQRDARGSDWVGHVLCHL